MRPRNSILAALVALTLAVPVHAEAPKVSLFPKPRPANLWSPLPEPLLQLFAGSVCGTETIRGTRLLPLKRTPNGCGVDDPVLVTSVSGITLSEAATLDCPTAKALDNWTREAVRPAFAAQGGLRRLTVAGSYECRPRNRQAGAKLSEHSLGHAIDISAFQLQDGTQVSVQKGWNSVLHGKTLRSLHAQACGPFGTVLGPDSDAFHADHFHLDTARYRKGSYCR